MSTKINLSDRVAVVTGAGRGIGRVHALSLAERGARVVVNDLGGFREGTGSSPGPANSVVEEIRSAGGDAVANFADISTPAGGETLILAALEAYGRVDIVVNNAGNYAPPRPFSETTIESLERYFKVHVGGTYNVLRAVWNHMVKQKYGRIINTTSTSALYGISQLPEYCAAKGGVQGLTLALAHEGKEHGILVNALAPGAWTRMSSTRPGADAFKDFRRPELVSPAVVWLASDECTATGGFYEAFVGRVARVVVGTPEGWWDLDMSPESIRDHVDEVHSRADLRYPTDPISWSAALVEVAKQRMGTSPVGEVAEDSTGVTGATV